MKYFIIFSIFTGLSFFVQTITSGQTWNVRDHIPFKELTIQCHRGAGNLSAENSVDAFNIAWGLGMIPEADIRLTKDGVIVAFHDNDFKRILPNVPAEIQRKGIADLTIEEVKNLDIGIWKGEKYAGQRVPAMKEICEMLKKNPKYRMYIDIKKIDFEQLAKETEGIHPQLILASTKYEEIVLWKKLAPASKTLHWMGAWGKDKERMEEILGERLKKLEDVNFASIDQLQIHIYTNPDGTIMPQEEFLRNAGERLRKHGVLFQILPWQGSDPKIYSRLMDLGAASFATDFPDVLHDAVLSYYNLKK